jgi:hypothetical protein
MSMVTSMVNWGRELATPEVLKICRFIHSEIDNQDGKCNKIKPYIAISTTFTALFSK